MSRAWGQTFVFRGTVLDEQTHKALDYATIQLFVENNRSSFIGLNAND